VEAACGKRRPRTDDHPAAGGIQVHDVERLAGGDADTAALADGVVDDALVAAKHAAVDVHDVAGLGGAGLQALDDLGIAAVGDEADVLAVMLVGDGKAKRARRRPRLGLGQSAEREAQEVELLLGGGEQEVALVALRVDRPVEGAVGALPPGHDVVAGGKRGCAEMAGRGEQVGEFDGLIAGDARYRCLAGDVAVGEALDHRLAEALLIVEHVMRDL